MFIYVHIVLESSRRTTLVQPEIERTSHKSIIKTRKKKEQAKRKEQVNYSILTPKAKTMIDIGNNNHNNNKSNNNRNINASSNANNENNNDYGISCHNSLRWIAHMDMPQRNALQTEIKTSLL